MDAARWQEIERLFHAAAACDPGARAAFLQQACDGDADLRAEVESLLDRESEYADFMEVPALKKFGAEVQMLLGPLAPGDRIAHYEIVAPMGEGGMGAVYRARDLRLHRSVAVKVLPPACAGDAKFMARFEHEARVLASLNHPNIAAIYGIEQGAIIMELVEGVDLRGPLPIEEIVPIARQIAVALEAAHERGVVHRDLKPPNIRVTPEGVVKLLDFGIARSVNEPTAVPGAPSTPPTREGMVLGTAAYMSPEQARGKAVDKRTDVWSFGVVLFELLTGRRLYDGETASDSIAAVITREPDWPALPKNTPTHLVQLLARCLVKDSKMRLRDIGEARILLEEPIAAPAAAPRPSSMPWILAAVCLALALVLGASLWRATSPVDRPLLRFLADLGPDALAGNRLTAAISPDGARLAYIVQRGATQLLATRRMDESATTILQGTEHASDPFFSPDGQWIAFAADGYLKKVPVQGGAPTNLCEVEVLRGGWWGEDGSIVFSSGATGLARVPAEGGVPRFLTRAAEKGEATQRYPQVLPDGKAILFTGLAANGQFDDANLEVLLVSTGETRVIQRGGYFGRYLPSGHLIFVHRGSLFAVPFDPSRYQTKGIPVPVLNDIAANPNSGGGELDFSRTGTLVYLGGKASAGEGAVFWLDAEGKREPFLSEPNLASPRFAPDGKRIAFSDGGVSVYDISRGAVTRLPGNRSTSSQFPVWAPDGTHIAYSSVDGIWWVRSDGSGEPYLLYRSQSGIAVPSSFSPDGGRLAFQQPGSAGRDLWTLPLDLADPDHPKAGKPELFLSGKSEHLEPAFSPDGKWLAYSSTEGGVFHVFVRPFPGGPEGGGQALISTGQGRVPVWSRSAKELFYVTGDDRLTVVPYTVSGNSFVPGTPRFWPGGLLANTGLTAPYDVAPDGKRIAIIPAPEGSNLRDKTDLHLTFLVHFFDELKRRATP
jgi:serine/threonine-protein kinase